MTSKSGIVIYDRVNGLKVVAYSVRTLEDGRQVRLHGVRKWSKIYWTADLGDTYGKSRAVAVQEAQTLDLVSADHPWGIRMHPARVG